MNYKRQINFKKCIATFIILINIMILLPLNVAAKQAELNTGSLYYGFQLVSKSEVKEIHSTAFIFNHVKSGAKLIYLENDDDNKTFCINFRTPPKDNTGVNHIIEHSVFCGSKNYPVKDASLAIGKQSVNTFLNAYTASDRTMYPVSSRNDKDFQNLMGIYLDSVFYPKILNNPNIFKQEGWHYELENKDDPLKCNGIVYSEMKGVYSDAATILNSAVNQSLFPDSIYKWDSGGKPDSILNLKYEDFIDTYKKYYHPSNSYVYLYGNMDINKALKYIDEKYLSNFEKKQMDTEIQPQKPLNSMNLKIAEYGVPKGALTKNKTYLSYNFLIGGFGNKQDMVGLQMLSRLLLGTDESPLRNYLWNDGFGVYGEFYNQALQTNFSIIAPYADEEYRDDFIRSVRSNLNKIAVEGFDKDLVDTIIKTSEKGLVIKNSETDRGIKYNDDIISSWLYNGNPTMYLQYDKEISEIKAMADSGYFQDLIKKYLLDNKDISIVVLRPKQGLEESNAQALNARLQKYKSSLTNKEIEDLIKETKELKEWQESPETKEAMDSIPSLSLADINTKAEITPTIQDKVEDIKVLKHSINTNGTSYIHMYFDTSGVPKENIKYIYLLSNILGRLDTQNYKHGKILNEINKNVQSINFNTQAYAKYNGNGEFYPKLKVGMSVVDADMEKGFEILNEIVNRSNFNDRKYIYELIQEEKSAFEDEVSENVQDLSSTRLESYFSDLGKYNDLGSMEYYKLLCDLERNFKSKHQRVIKNLSEVMNTVFNKNNLIVSFTGNDEEYKKFVDNFKDFSKNIKNEKIEKQEYKFNFTNKNEGIVIPSKVQYVVKGYDFKKFGYKYNGSMKVLANILNNEYLWQKVRVKGGAYGSDVWISPLGYVEFSSYRDPNLKETLDAFKNSGIFVRNFNASDEEMTNYIIGTIGAMDEPMTPNEKASIADMNYITGRTDKDIQVERDEILNTKSQDIRKLANMMDSVLKEDYQCVFGNETKIKGNKSLFNKIEFLIND